MGAVGEGICSPREQKISAKKEKPEREELRKPKKKHSIKEENSLESQEMTGKVSARSSCHHQRLTKNKRKIEQKKK